MSATHLYLGWHSGIGAWWLGGIVARWHLSQWTRLVKSPKLDPPRETEYALYESMETQANETGRGGRATRRVILDELFWISYLWPEEAA